MENRALKYTIGFVAVGIIITLLVAYVQHKTITTGKRDMLNKSLGHQVNNLITTANMLLENLVHGDIRYSFDQDVLSKYTAAQSLLQGAYDGSETGLGRFEKTTDEAYKVHLKETINDIDRLAAAARERLAESQSMQPSTDSITVAVNTHDSEKKFDDANDKFQATFGRLTGYVNKEIDSDASIQNTISWFSALIVMGTFILLGAMLYSIQHKSDLAKMESEHRLAQQAGASDKISDFIEGVSAGNYAASLTLEGNEDLTNKLITMRDKLKENTESERKRGWSTMGLAQIGEILRATSSNSSELYDNIIKFIVKYARSTQGGLFIINEEKQNEDVSLELAACYAFERKKFLTKKVMPGEGLVGQCLLEGERIYLTEVPEEYISISSGLGGAKPKSLLLVPMKFNGKIYGVLELASFNKFEDFEIELVEKLAENVASTVSTVRINDSTRILLDKTKHQAVEMKEQEEEIRQSMEELEATQEEMRRKQLVVEKELAQSQQQTESLRTQERKLIESQDTLQAIVDNLPRAIFWKNKDLLFAGCNKIFANIAGLTSTRDVVGKSDYDMPWNDQAEAYRKDDLEVMKNREAKLDIEEVNINSNNEESWVLTSKVPIINPDNEVVAILGMFEDITQRKLREADITNKLKERDQALEEIQKLKHLLEAKG